MTSRQTNASRGKVLSILRPKQLWLVSRSYQEKREHLQARYVHHKIVCWEVIEYIALGFIPKGEEPCESHRQAGHHGNGRGIVGDSCEAIHGRLLQRSID